MNNFIDCPLFQERVYCYELYHFNNIDNSVSTIFQTILNKGMSYALLVPFSEDKVLYVRSAGERSLQEDDYPETGEKLFFSFDDIIAMASKESAFNGISIITFMEAISHVE